MPQYDGSYWTPTSSGMGNVGFVGFNINNGRVVPQPPEPVLYRKIKISDGLRGFLNSKSQHLSTACYFTKSYILGELDSHYGEKIDNEVFSKINYLSESDNGYVIINGNQKIRLGKLVVKIGDVVKIKTNEKNEAIGIENFVDEYKSWYKVINNLKFKVLKGEDIFEGYTTKLHATNTGMLGCSCMNNKYDLLHLYSDNEEKVKLLTLVDDNGKIYGRAFLWNIDNRPFIFMDRIYGIDNYINNIFIDYAKQEKMAFREQEQLYNFTIYIPTEDWKQSVKEAFNYPLKVKLNCNHLQYLPYMDSLYIWNRWTNTFSNNDKVESNMKYHTLKNTGGGVGRPGIKILGIKLKNEF